MIIKKKEGKKERYLAYCPTCNALYDADFVRREGKYYVSTFIHSHPLVFVKLIASNSGHGYTSYEEGFPEDVKKIVNYLWVWQGKSDMEILDIFNDHEKFLKTLREIEELEKATPPPTMKEPNVKLLVKTQRTSLLNIAVKTSDNMDCRDVRLLDAVIHSLNKMPQRLKLPDNYKNCDYSIPRYYVISAYYDAERNQAEIIDIYNWDKKRGQPGKWSYRNGFWAPIISREIAKTLKLYITMLVKSLV